MGKTWRKEKLLTSGNVSLAEGRDRRKGADRKEELGQLSAWLELGVEGGVQTNVGFKLRCPRSSDGCISGNGDIRRVLTLQEREAC